MSFILCNISQKYQRKKMTTIKTVLLGISLFALTACGDDNKTTQESNENNPSQITQNGHINNEVNDSQTTEDNEGNSSQATEDNGENPSQDNIQNPSTEPYVAPSEFNEALIVGKNFYEAEDENEDGIFTLNEWMQITFLSNSKFTSARNGQQYPIRSYTLEEGKLFFSIEEDGETHTDIISIESASQIELNISTTDGDRPTWIFEVALKEEMVLGKTFTFKSNNNNIDYTLNYDNNHTLTLSTSTKQVSTGSYEIKNGILTQTLEDKTSTNRVIQTNKEGDLLMWHSNDLKATWYRLVKP